MTGGSLGEAACQLCTSGSSGGRSSAVVALGVLYAIAEGLDTSVFDATMEGLEPLDLHAGCSELPNQAGVWFRVMAADAPSAQAAVMAAWTATRLRLLGSPPPVSRRY